MATTNDGGPAFPKPLDPYPNAQGMASGWNGMSLWDWFFGHALASEVLGRTYQNQPGLLAEKAADQADAAIAERARRGIGP